MSSDLYIRAATLAAEQRRLLGLGDDPIVDARALVERQGVLVYLTPIGGGSLAGCFAVIGGDAWVMVNSAQSLGRQRFTMAHEYCHSLVDRELGFVACGREKPAHEKLADAFAAAFLMPHDGTRAFFSQGLGHTKVEPHKIIDFCYAYGVSYRAAVYRLHNLRFFPAGRRDELLEHSPLREATAMGYDLQDPTSPFFQSGSGGCSEFDSLPRAFRSLAIEAFESRRISESKLAELLGVEVDELDDMLDPAEADDVPVG